MVWASANTNPAVLYAYNAKNLQELYNSNRAANGRAHFGAGNKFTTPMFANSKVYVGTTNGVGVFGLLSTPSAGAPAAGSQISSGPGGHDYGPASTEQSCSLVTVSAVPAVSKP